MRDQLDRIETRIDDLVIIAAKNTAVLEEHQRRSLALEAHVQTLETQLQPVKAHVDFLNKAAKVLVSIAALAVALKNLGLV